jgi:multidrug efflux pump subunit AcrA (membrane-fusion protein)
MTIRRLLIACLLPLSAQAADLTTRPLAELVSYPTYRVSATAAPREETRLAFAVGGRIERLPLRVGEAVGRGQVVVALDAREYRIAVARAKAQLALVDNQIALARSQLAQNESLAQARFVSEDALRIKRTELAVRRSERDAARQALAAAELDLDRATLRAPFDAVVRERLASVGDFVAVGAPVLVLAATAEPEIRAAVPAAQVASLEIAGQWALHAAGAAVPLRLLRVSPLVDAAGQTREAVFAPLAPMPVGLAGEVRWRGSQALLPPGYVQQRDGAFGVYVMPGEVPEFRLLPGAQAGRPVPVPAGWPAQLPVVDAGRFQIGLETPAEPAR